MAIHKKRKMVEESNRSNAPSIQYRFTQPPSAPTSREDRLHWKGFCEIESEPAFFNVMLKRFGVQGVKVREVVSLDDEILMDLPRPVYGLIFLFKWVEEDSEKQEQSCPEEVWFANQTINNACASVALLNIVNNIPNLELGEHLYSFKEFTAAFSPALRGDAIGNFEFVKAIHNSFARKMDMLNADLLLKKEATANAKSKKRKADEDESEPGFHFIAFLPIEDQVWKLDGLERQPMCLGEFQNDWLSHAKPDIEARMVQYEEYQIEFAILSLVRDPLLDLTAKLAKNVKSIVRLSARLDAIKSDWKDFDLASVNGDTAAVIVTPNETYGLPQEVLDEATIPMEIEKLSESDEVEDLITQRQNLVSAQAGLRMSIIEEQQSNQADEGKVTARRYDYGARMQDFVRKVKATRQALDEVDSS